MEQVKKDMDDPENRECTFKPQVASGKESASGALNSANKWEELYHQAARK